MQVKVWHTKKPKPIQIEPLQFHNYNENQGLLPQIQQGWPLLKQMFSLICFVISSNQNICKVMSDLHAGTSPQLSILWTEAPGKTLNNYAFKVRKHSHWLHASWNTYKVLRVHVCICWKIALFLLVLGWLKKSFLTKIEPVKII